MVNQRQILKQNVEADLRKKIQSTQLILNRLHGALEQVEERSLKAKGEVKEAVRSVQKLMETRKHELARQIDIICHKQISSLQEDIQTTCIALGSLQSTLSNLKNFDQSQLENLTIPNVPLNVTLDPSPVEVKVNNNNLNQEIRNWASITSKGVNGLFDVGTSASLPRRFVEYTDGRNGQDMMSHKSVCEDILAKQQKSKSGNDVFGEVQTIGFETTCDIEQWLLGVNLNSSDADDFEIISFESSSIPKCSDVPEKEFPCKVSDGVSNIWVEENPSSDLSKWLKPRKLKQDTLSSVCTSAFAHNPLKNRFVEFPCLLIEPEAWIPAKKAKPSCQLSLSSEILPSEYSLPNGYWLKKH